MHDVADVAQFAVSVSSPITGEFKINEFFESFQHLICA